MVAEAPVKVNVEAIVDGAARSRRWFRDYLRFVHGWEVRPHQEPWIRALQALADGELRDMSGQPTVKLAIEAFPGSGKTAMVTRWASWMLGRETLRGNTPAAGYTSYSDDVAQLRSVAIRDTIEYNKNYREYVFPTARAWKEKGWGQKEWFLWRPDPSVEFPTLRAAGFGGSILSYRFPTFLIIDDPHDPNNVRTPGQRDETWRLWRGAIRTRTTQGVTPIVGIWTRWAKDDLGGRLKEVEGDWAVLHTPALDDFEQSVWPPEVIDGTPVGLSTETLLKMRDEDRHSFITQYQALPPSEGQGEIFQYFHEGPKPYIDDVVEIVQFWDTATTWKTHSSHNAMAEFWRLKNKRAYLNRVVNLKLEPNHLVDLIVEMYWQAKEHNKPVLSCIEDQQAGPAFADFVWAKAGIRLKRHAIGGFGKGSGHRGQRDLMSRAIAVCKYMETGQVFLPNTWEPWKDGCLEQLRAFGVSRTSSDDIVAAVVGGCERLFPNYAMGRPVAPVRWNW